MYICVVIIHITHNGISTHKHTKYTWSSLAEVLVSRVRCREFARGGAPGVHALHDGARRRRGGEMPIPYYTIIYYTVLYYTILYYTILYCTILMHFMMEPEDDVEARCRDSL